jgi:hypothetical protein
VGRRVLFQLYLSGMDELIDGSVVRSSPFAACLSHHSLVFSLSLFIDHMHCSSSGSSDNYTPDVLQTVLFFSL